MRIVVKNIFEIDGTWTSRTLMAPIDFGIFMFLCEGRIYHPIMPDISNTECVGWFMCKYHYWWSTFINIFIYIFTLLTLFDLMGYERIYHPTLPWWGWSSSKDTGFLEAVLALNSWPTDELTEVKLLFCFDG